MVEGILLKYMEELRIGGHTVEFRMEALNSATRGYIRMWESQVKGEGWVNRPEKSTRKARRHSKLMGKTNWFRTTKQPDDRSTTTGAKKGKKSQKQAEVEGVIYVPYTPDSRLKRQIQKLEDAFQRGKSVGRMRVVERLGATLGELLCNPTPWTNSHCGRTGGLTCKAKEGSCKAVGATYEWRCNQCTRDGKTVVYCGETARALWDRTEEHLNALKRRQESSFLWKHWANHHSTEETPDFSVKPL